MAVIGGGREAKRRHEFPFSCADAKLRLYEAQIAHNRPTGGGTSRLRALRRGSHVSAPGTKSWGVLPPRPHDAARRFAIKAVILAANLAGDEGKDPYEYGVLSKGGYGKRERVAAIHSSYDAKPPLSVNDFHPMMHVNRDTRGLRYKTPASV